MQRERCADADARAVTERQVGEAINGFRVGKAGGVESVGVFPQSVMAVQGVDRQDHGIAPANFAAQQGIGCLCRARQEGGGGIHPQGLIDDAAGEGEVCDIGDGGGPVAQGGLRLGAGCGLDLGGEGAEVKRPRQGKGGGLVARDDKGQQVVAKFCRGHLALAGGVFGFQQ